LFKRSQNYQHPIGYGSNRDEIDRQTDREIYRWIDRYIRVCVRERDRELERGGEIERMRERKVEWDIYLRIDMSVRESEMKIEIRYQRARGLDN
jgi:hypothetical protein